MSFFHFELEAFHYAARCRGSVVLLRAGLDAYASLSLEASSALSYALKHRFFRKNGLFMPVLDGTESQVSMPFIKKINQSVAYFLENGLIRVTARKERRNHIASPLDEAGLVARDWCAQGPSDVPLDKKLAFKALFTLHKVYRILRKKRLVGALAFLKSLSLKSNIFEPSKDYSQVATRALEAACLIYPGKTTCLPFALTLAALHYQQHYTCDFVIGVQSLPFYAHAWVEADGKVVRDIQNLKGQLAPILRFTPKLGAV
ncbi:MAG: lasso peptide biosynthesis B2 protein [Alphaproteobacteria bacterium]